MSDRILIVEDEQDLVSILEFNLQKEGYQTLSALTGSEAFQILSEKDIPDLVLLDLMLPDISGTEICKMMRQKKHLQHTPVIMLTAKGEEIDRVVGFEVGADDYVIKPFSVRELMLRIKAILRRAQPPEETPVNTTFGVLRIDQEGHRVWVKDVEVILTALEFKLLLTFLTRKGRVQSRDQLLNDVWGINADVVTRTVDTHVKRLREKLGPAGNYIETLRGVGYRFLDQPDLDDKEK